MPRCTDLAVCLTLLTLSCGSTKSADTAAGATGTPAGSTGGGNTTGVPGGTASGSPSGNPAGTPTGTTSGTTSGTATSTGTNAQTVCNAAMTDPAALDALQVQGDGQTVICHRAAGVWALMTVSIADCLLHLNSHPNDLFPAEICGS